MPEKLGLYIHIPFCRSKCDYCDFYSLAGREERMDDYQKALLAHMKETAPLTRGWQVDTVYFGGGTPSFYGAKRLKELLRLISKRFDLAKDAEITVECNPDSVDLKTFQALRRAGVNRISLGVQSAHDCELQSLHRPHTFEQAKEAVEAAFDLNNLELRDVIEQMAEELFEAVEGPAGEKPEAHVKATPPERPKAEPMKPLRPVGLMYTPLTKQAMAICFNAHKNQLDKSGMPYVFHPFHLAEQMETEHEVCVALLHDVIEDSDHTPGELSQAGFPDEVVRAVRALTRDPHMHYLDYVARLRQNPIARRVKLADLVHNSDLNRLGYVSHQDRRRVLKYRMAQAILGDDRYDEALEHFRKVIPLSLDEPLFLSVFYDRQGVVQKYSIAIEEAEDSHYELDPPQAEKLRLALASSRTLPEALADWVQGGSGCHQVESVLVKYGIAFQSFHFYG